jgi:ABC-type dipeptide/oligopeptide/nickel transport system permease component
MFQGKPVHELIGSGLWVSLQLNLAAIVIGLSVGIPLGIIAALYRNTFLDYLAMATAIAGISFPSFVLGPILMWIFVARLGLFSIGWDGLFSTRAIMPVFIMSLGPIAVFARQTRANLAEELDADYVRTARSKGLSEQAVVVGHALRNALIPLLTIFGLMLGGLVSGSFITEEIFGIPGIGRLGVQAFFSRDYPVIMALTLIIAVAYAIANLLVDMFYAVVDPRIRYE